MLNVDNQTLETNVFYKILKVLLYALLGTPLLIWSIFLFPFITTKVLYLRILIEAAIVIYIPLAVKFPTLRPKWNWLTIAVWAYMAVLLVTSIFGVNFSKSFMGTVERGEGIVTMLHFAAYFTMLASVFRSKIDWQKYLTAAVAVIVFAGLIGLVQLACDETAVKGLCGLVPPTQGARISATIGNAAFYAGFMLFGLFLSLYLAWGSKQSDRKSLWKGALWFIGGIIAFIMIGRQVFGASGFVSTIVSLFALCATLYGIYKLLLGGKWSYFAAAAFSLYILVETQTRGGAIGAYLGLLVLAGYLALRAQNKGRRMIAGAAAILMLIPPILIFTNAELLPDFLEKIPVVRRLSTISMNDITTQSRFDTWRASWSGFEDRFLTGYGYENFNVAFNEYFPARIFKDAGSQIWFDRAHSVLFDVLVASGILGLAAYTSIFLAALVYLYRLFRKNVGTSDQKLYLTLAVLLLGYVIQNMFVFDTHATYLIFFAVLAHIAFLRREAEPEPEMPPAAAAIGPVLPGIVAAVMLVVLYFVNIEPAIANIRATEAIKYAKLKEYRKVSDQFKLALSYGTYMDEEIRQRMVDYANEAVNSGQLSDKEVSDLYKFVLEEIEKNAKQAPHDVKNFLYLMNTYNTIAVYQPEYADKVFELGEQAAKLSPTRPHIYFEMGQAAFSKKEFDRGLDFFRKAIEINPEPRETHLNYLLALVYAQREDLVAAEKEFIIKRFGGLSASEYIAVARGYARIANNQKVIDTFKESVAVYPDNSDLYAQLAGAYGNVCDIANASLAARTAGQINPELAAAVEQFISETQTNCEKK